MSKVSAALDRHAHMRRADKLLVILGDQLQRAAPALDRLDPERDAIVMSEVREEATHVASHRQRTSLFLWVTAPNVIGMSQHADHGVVGTKPYVASGRYIQRMSNYCKDCRYDPSKRTGENACPYTTMYWDFLARHRERFDGNRRMTMMLKNVDRIDAAELGDIRRRATRLRDDWGVGAIVAS